MKLLHISDLHIGSSLTTHLEQKKVTERRNEIRDAFGRAVEFGISEGIEAVLIAGDMFDGKKIGPRTLAGVASVIRAHGDIPFFYVSGNHEGDVFCETGKLLENFYTFGEGFSYYDLDGVRIHGANATAKGMFSTLELNAQGKNIVMLHGEWGDHSAEGGIIGLGELEGVAVDYLALGHYHSFMTKEIYRGGIAVYSGVPEGRGYDEAGEKGVVIFDTADFVPHFYPLAKRTIHIVEVNAKGATSASEILTRAEKSVATIPSDDMVEMVLIGACDPMISLDESLFLLHFSRSFYHFRFKNKTTVDISAQSLKYDSSIVGEFIRQVYSDTTLSEDEKRDIIECGLLAIKKEEWGK